MIGTLLNVTAILTGGAVGLSSRKEPSPTTQSRIKIGLALATIYVAFTLIWQSIRGGFGGAARLIVIGVAALLLGNLLGKWLGLQQSLNRLGQYAKAQFSSPRSSGGGPTSQAFITGAILFCLSPLAIAGPLLEGLTSDIRPLLIKSVIDGLAALVMVRSLGRGVLLSAVPVLAVQGTLTIFGRGIELWLYAHGLLDPITGTMGLLLLTLPLVILDLWKVPFADYLPALLIAPILGWVWR